MTTPYNRACKLVQIECHGQVFVINLANKIWRHTITTTPSAQRADHLAYILRQIIATEIAQALTDEDCRLGAEIDQAYFSGEIWHVPHTSALCRRLAELHTIDCIREIGQKNRQQPSGDNQSPQ